MISMTANPSSSAHVNSISTTRFHQLDAIRGIAALTVVLSHYVSVVSSDPTLGETVLKTALTYVVRSPLGGVVIGLPAVLLFFILSGFALTKMLQGSGGKDSYLAYSVKRITRIWPPYLLSIGLTVAFVATIGWPAGEHIGGWVSGIIGHPLSTPDIIDHALLLGSFAPHYNFVAWTLVYEMRISLLFPVIYFTLLRWSFRKALLIYTAISIISVGLHYWAKFNGYIQFSNWIATAHFALFFVIGGLIALNLPRIKNWYQKLSGITKIALLFLTVFGYTYPPQIRDLGGIFKGFPMILTHWAILPSVSLMVIFALTSPKLENFLLRPFWQWLGKVSYSLYLFHPLVLFLMVGFLNENFSVGMVSLVGIGLSLLLAAAMYRWIELPSQRVGRTLASSLTARGF